MSAGTLESPCPGTEKIGYCSPPPCSEPAFASPSTTDTPQCFGFFQLSPLVANLFRVALALTFVWIVYQLNAPVSAGLRINEHHERHDERPKPKWRFDEPTFISECLHPMGGGLVGPGGSFHAINDSFLSHECAAELSDYFCQEDGQYLVDVARVAESARRYFEDLSLREPPTSKMVVVFDIDETTLSNAKEWQEQIRIQKQLHEDKLRNSLDEPEMSRLKEADLEQQRPHDQEEQQGAGVAASAAVVASGRKLMAGSGSRSSSGLQAGAAGRRPLTRRSSCNGLVTSGAPVPSMAASSPEANFMLSLSGDDSTGSPPLAPMLGLYHYFYAQGFSVAFITGRRESSRNSTATNLQNAGYGTLCKTKYSGKDQAGQQHVREQQARQLAKADAGAGADGSEGRSGADDKDDGSASGLGAADVGRPGSPCYVALHFRTMDDTRLASVFKPERRQDLEDEGYTIYGNFGDQFSDLEGTAAAPHSFKLPNPAYMIL